MAHKDHLHISLRPNEPLVSQRTSLHVGESTQHNAERTKRNNPVVEVQTSVSEHTPIPKEKSSPRVDRSHDGTYVVLKIGKDRFWVYGHRSSIARFRNEWGGGKEESNKGELRRALLEVLDQVQIFHGPTAYPNRPSKSHLVSVFGDDNEEAIAGRILLNGSLE